MGATSDFLNKEVFPKLDAVDAGLLDDFNPVKRDKYYALNCPGDCGAEGIGRAFYYPQGAGVTCNRRSYHNGNNWFSLWDIVQSRANLSPRETFLKLCTAAHVQPPGDNRSTAEKQKASLARAFFDATREALMASGAALEYLRSARQMTDSEIERARIGYYPSESYMRERLKAAGCDLREAEAWEILDQSGSKRASRKLAKRVVGYWEQPDGSIRPWGRAFGESAKPYLDAGGQSVTPNKYEFSYGMVKSLPYRFRGVQANGVVIAVEGPLDAERMVINGIPAIAVGGACVIEEQAKYLAARGISALIHLTDGDVAGYHGGLQSIRFCEPYGISTYIAAIPEGEDDPDKLIATKGTEPLLALLDAAMNGGAYLARDYLGARERYGVDFARAAQERLLLRTRLTPMSMAGFDAYLHSQGISLPPPRALAFRLAGELIHAGLSDEEIARIVKARYGVNVFPAPENNDVR